MRILLCSSKYYAPWMSASENLLQILGFYLLFIAVNNPAPIPISNFKSYPILAAPVTRDRFWNRGRQLQTPPEIMFTIMAKSTNTSIYNSSNSHAYEITVEGKR